jgi:hypothetical protein
MAFVMAVTTRYAVSQNKKGYLVYKNFHLKTRKTAQTIPSPMENLYVFPILPKKPIE